MPPYNFGDVFVQSFQQGQKTAQDETQFQQTKALESQKLAEQASEHAQAISLEEKKMKMTQALEALKMDALNRQIDIQQKELVERSRQNSTAAIDEFNKSWIGIDPTNPYVKGQKLRTADELRQLHPGVKIPEGQYLDAQSMQGILGLMQIDRARAAEEAKIAKQNLPYMEAEQLNEEFDREPLPNQTISKSEPAFPGLWEGIKNAFGNVDLSQEGLGRASIGHQLVEGFTKKTGIETTQQIDLPSIKDYLNKQAPVIGKILPRAKGENYPMYGSKIATYVSIGESLLRVDENGNASLDTSGLTPKAASNVLYAIASSHKTGYLTALAEAQQNFKNTAMTDKSRAEEEYQQAVAMAEKQYPLHKESVGQVFGQRYATR